MRHLPPSHLLPVLAAALSAGCAPGNLFHRGTPTPEPSVVEVRNDRWEDMTVYLEREGSLFRLGVVPGKGSKELTIPDDYLRLNCWVRFVARTTGRKAQAASELFGVDPGSHVSWFVPLASGETPVMVTPG